jgi:hypothetical protein
VSHSTSGGQCVHLQNRGNCPSLKSASGGEDERKRELGKSVGEPQATEEVFTGKSQNEEAGDHVTMMHPSWRPQ